MMIGSRMRCGKPCDGSFGRWMDGLGALCELLGSADRNTNRLVDVLARISVCRRSLLLVRRHIGSVKMNVFVKNRNSTY